MADTYKPVVYFGIVAHSQADIDLAHKLLSENKIEVDPDATWEMYKELINGKEEACFTVSTYTPAELELAAKVLSDNGLEHDADIRHWSDQNIVCCCYCNYSEKDHKNGKCPDTYVKE